jgi:prepilin-type N-terminal cleavage/methylation domain-containing protein
MATNHPFTFGKNIMKTDRKGFTLVELIVIVSIIGVITFIAVPRLVMATIALGRSQTGAEKIAAAIRHCRTLAISNANAYPQGFKVNMTGSGSYTGLQIINVQTSAVVESSTIPAKVTCTGANDFVFGPLGNRTGDTDSLTVSGGGKTYLISVVTGTGMVKCTQQ